VFYVDLIRLAAEDPLPLQKRDNEQPPAVLIDGITEHVVKEILYIKWVVEKGGYRTRKVFVKWKGYVELLWEPVANYKEVEALDVFEGKYRDVWMNDGPLKRYDKSAMISVSKKGAGEGAI